MDQTKIAEELLKKARPVADQAEIFISSVKELRIDVLSGKVESLEQVKETGLAVRLISGRKLGFAYSSDLSEEAAEEAIRLAAANALETESDEYNLLPLPPSPNKLDLFDPQIAAAPLYALIMGKSGRFGHQSQIDLAQKRRGCDLRIK